MAYDKAVDSVVLDSTLTAIANAIREKGGTTDPIAFNAMAAAVAAIEAGGGGEGGYDFSELPTTFTHAISGSFILDADRNWKDHSISVPNSINITNEKPVIALIFSNDSETVYSSTVKTAQVLFCYDEAPRQTSKNKQTVGFYACTTTTGSYDSYVYGALGKGGSELVKYGPKDDNTINVVVGSYAISLSAHSGVSTAYYLAGKKYYWLLLGCEV